MNVLHQLRNEKVIIQETLNLASSNTLSANGPLISDERETTINKFSNHSQVHNLVEIKQMMKGEGKCDSGSALNDHIED